LKFFYFLDWGWSSELCTHEADALSLEPHLPVHFALVILEIKSLKLLAWAGLEPQSS
jgi:hypothetical protein